MLNIGRYVRMMLLVMPVVATAQPAIDNVTSQRDARSILSAFMSYADLRIMSVQRSLEVIAATAEARSAQWPSVSDPMRAYQASDPDLVIWYLRPDGRYYTTDSGLVSMTLSDRSYFPALMAGTTITGALVVSKVTGLRSAIIAVPVRRDGVVVGAIGASLFLDSLADEIGRMLELRSDAVFFAMAPSGLTTLHSRKDRHFVDPREVGSPTLARAAEEMLSEASGSTSYEFEGFIKHALWRTSSLTQWRFVLTISVSPVGVDTHGR